MELGNGKWSPSPSPPSSPSSSSPCSITELFKKKESPAAGIIEILFPHQPKVVGDHSLLPHMIGKSQGSLNQPWNTQHGTSANGEVDSHQRVQQPFCLSSSIFYGGQDDIYTSPKHHSDSSSSFEDIGVDDSEFASRGNWWQGSLYY